jgi:tryptophanyl-tRNA synthetase
LKRVLSGMRPTGRLHLGHLEGVLKNWVKLQDEYDCFFFVADWHALTDNLDTGGRSDSIDNMVIDWLSAGIDPEKCTLFIQSEVPMHAELHLLLSMVTPVGWLERCPTYKDVISSGGASGSPSYGLLGYPVLQTADILMYRAESVPVGQDQVAHLEIAREIARRFNGIYGNVFPEPLPLLTASARLAGLDGRKMSKSYGNSIMISDPDDEILKKVRTMITDPARVYRKDKGHPEVCGVFEYHAMFSPDEVSEIESSCRSALIGCSDCKKKLSAAICRSLEPVRQRRQSIGNNPGMIRGILEAGARKARISAAETMGKVKEAMRFPADTA